MTHVRLTLAQVVPVRSALLQKQGFKCPLCEGSMRSTAKKSPALDHDHQTGFVRDVLCINCNGIEGKVFNLIRRAKGDLEPLQWLQNFMDYHERHKTPQHGGILHHTHKTPEEKREAANKKARAKRAAAKKASA